ncbi:histidine kinase [Flammeovirga sp. MY04]|uniref:sensor histidine kinase n=1 Tax=Flammeovirga sp. MY04 TaxID=1191459 RepID=UPI0013052563|nr:histidine kinase [Flammeovirga sp. MY04]ANQ48166.2 histidine kinase [Flammeovirga sp. MY04]
MSIDLITSIVLCLGSVSIVYFCIKLIDAKKFSIAIALLILGYIGLVYLYNIILWELKWNYYIPSYQRVTITVDDFIVVFFPFGVGAGIEIVFEHLKQLKNKQQLILEKTKAELNFLKGQISPHFLFNTINTIFWLIVKDPKEAQQLLMTLSDMLRYQLYECEQNFVPIQKEVDYLNHLFKIQESRKREDVVINKTIEIEDKNFMIPPLLFLPLIENAMKYVSQKKKEENFIHLYLQQKENSCVFEIRNSVDESTVSIKEDKKYSGIGLSNIQKRLQLLFGDAHEFKTLQLNNIYYANIKF